MPLFRRKPPDPLPEPQPRQFPVDPPTPGPAGLRSLRAHQDFLLQLAQPLLPFGVNLLDAVGLQVVEAIDAEVDLPGCDGADRDGYALRAVDISTAGPQTPVRLPVAGTLILGDDPDDLEPGTAVWVCAGAPLPPGADTVVIAEKTDRGGEQVQVYAAEPAGRHVRHRGSDTTEGELLIDEGETLDVRRVGLLAAVGIDKVLVRPRPRVVVISVGDELVEPGGQLGSGQCYDATSYLVAAAAKAAGAQVWRVGHLGEEPDQVRDVITDQLIRADLIVTIGGIREGDALRQVVPELGPCDIASVAMRSGQLQGVGLIGDDEVPILMLPADPVAAYVSFEAFARPVIRKLMGAEPYLRPEAEAVTMTAIASEPGFDQLALVQVTRTANGLEATRIDGHTAHLLSYLADANAVALLERQTQFAGERIRVWLLE